MTKRAERLAEYLENELGLSLFETTPIFPKYEIIPYGDPNFLKSRTNQGNDKVNKNDVIAALERAISFAIDQS